MAFNQSNPTFSLVAGQPVELTIRNEDRGILHDFAIDGLAVKLSRPLRTGEEEILKFTAPAVGAYRYYCPAHPGMMEGRLIVQPASQSAQF